MRPTLALLLVLAATSFTLAQPTDDPDAIRQATRDYIEELKLHNQSGIGTSLDDVSSDLAVLDGFRPTDTVPMGAMPRLAGGGYILVAPGCYELDAATFCLHAGAYRPGGGDGYALAPLNGMGAPIAEAVLRGWLDHPELPQTRIQGLLWAIDERIPYGELGPSLTEAADALLAPAEIESWRGLGRGERPRAPDMADPDVLAQADAELAAVMDAPPPLGLEVRAAELERRIGEGAMDDPQELQALMAEMMEIQAEINARLEAQYEAMREYQETVLPMFQANQIVYEEMARRMAPEGDPAPPEGSREIPLCRWSLDPAGYFVRFVPIASYERCLVSVSVPPASSLERDASGRVAGVTAGQWRMRIQYGDAGAIEAVRVTDPSGGIDEMPAVRRVAWPEAQPDAVRELDDRLASLAPRGASSHPRSDALALATLVTALASAMDWSPADDPRDEETVMPRVLGVTYLALQDAILRCLRPTGESTGTASKHGSWIVAAQGGGGDRLEWFDPNDNRVIIDVNGQRVHVVDLTSKVAQPGNTGRQRLGIAPRGHDDSDGKDAMDRAERAMSALSVAFDIVNAVADPAGFLLDKVGLGTGLVGQMLEEYLATVMDVAKQISQALGGDPPRDDYDSLDLPRAPDLPPVQGEDVPAERVAAIQELVTACTQVFSHARAAQVCLDRMGGAARADDDDWVHRQALALVHHKRETGLAMLRTASALDHLADMIEADGGDGPKITQAVVEACRAALGDERSRVHERVAELLGLSADGLEVSRMRRLEGLDRFQKSTPPPRRLRDTADALRSLGGIWADLPKVAANMPSPEA